MASLITPVWTTTGVLTAPKCLARGSTIRATLDLRAKFGAKIFAGIGRGGTTTLTAPGVYFICRAMPGDGTVGRILSPFAQMNTSNPATAAGQNLINNGAGYAAGTTAFTIDGAGTPVVDDWFCFWGATAIPADGTALTTCEFVRVAKYAANVLTADAPSLFLHADNEILTSRADCGVFDLPGGAMYEFIWDYVAHAAGDSAAVGAWYSTYDSNSAT